MPQIKLIAIHNFAGAEEGDLPFAKGDELIGLELTDHEQWWSGEDMNGKKGQFPANYVQKKQKVNQAGMGARRFNLFLDPIATAIERVLTFLSLIQNHLLYRHLLYRHLLLSSSSFIVIG